MKTTIDLPDDLVHEIQSRAARQGRQAGDVMAELLRREFAMNISPSEQAPPPQITTDSETGLPLIKCRHPASSDEELTPLRTAEILVEQELAWYREAGR